MATTTCNCWWFAGHLVFAKRLHFQSFTTWRSRVAFFTENLSFDWVLLFAALLIWKPSLLVRKTYPDPYYTNQRALSISKPSFVGSDWRRMCFGYYLAYRCNWGGRSARSTYAPPFQKRAWWHSLSKSTTDTERLSLHKNNCQTSLKVHEGSHIKYCVWHLCLKEHLSEQSIDEIKHDRYNRSKLVVEGCTTRKEDRHNNNKSLDRSVWYLKWHKLSRKERETKQKRTTRMEFSARVIALISALSSGVNADSFNYRSTKGDDYGPADWNKVSCGNLETCVSSS